MNPWEKTPRSEPDPAPVPAVPVPTEPAGATPAQTTRLNAEAVKLVAEANESRARQLRELEEITARLHRNLVAEAERLQVLDQDLRKREAKAQEMERLYKEGAELKRQAEAQALESQRALAAVGARAAEAENAEQRAREAQVKSEAAALEAQTERAKHQAALEQLKAETARMETARAQALAARQEAQRLRDEADQLLARLWPAALGAEPWRACRERLLQRAATEPLAGLLLARLHAVAALEQSGRPCPLELVRELGRSVYETLPELAEKIAQALTRTAAGRFDLRTVRPGDRIDNKFMKPSVSGLAEVHAVSGWAVRDANGLWQFPAEVS